MGYESVHVRASGTHPVIPERKEAAGWTQMGSTEETRELIGKTGRSSEGCGSCAERRRLRALRVLVHQTENTTGAAQALSFRFHILPEEMVKVDAAKPRPPAPHHQSHSRAERGQEGPWGGGVTFCGPDLGSSGGILPITNNLHQIFLDYLVLDGSALHPRCRRPTSGGASCFPAPVLPHSRQL